jgi:hypothetical protein
MRSDSAQGFYWHANTEENEWAEMAAAEHRCEATRAEGDEPRVRSCVAFASQRRLMLGVSRQSPTAQFKAQGGRP